MKFLITCYRLDLTGSSTYTFTLASELKRKGHEVNVFSPFPEIIANELKKKDIRVYEALEEVPNEKYTCIIAQHNVLALMVRSIKAEVPMICISHGILPFLEQPPSVNINIQKYVAVSEEVKTNLTLNHGVSPKNVEIVRNFVDFNRFFPQSEISESPKVVLFMSNQIASEVFETVKGACKKLKLKLIMIGRTKQVLNTEDYINKADIVISLGRGILEAMACGRAAIVYDYQGGDGMITPNTINEIRKHNFSGRRFKNNYGIKDLIQEIKKFDKSMGKINREIILKDYNASLLSDKIINTCNQAQNNFCPRSISIPSKELIWYQNEIRNVQPINVNQNLDTQKDFYINLLASWNGLQAIHNSHGWKLLRCYYKFRNKIFPPNTRRRVYAKSLFKMIISMNDIKKRFLEKVYSIAHLVYKNLPLSVRRSIVVNKFACLVRAILLHQLADEPIYPLKKTLAFFHKKQSDRLNIEYSENTLSSMGKDTITPDNIKAFGILLDSVKKAKQTVLIFDHALGGGANIHRKNYIKDKKKEYAFLTLQYRIGLDYKLTFCFRDYKFLFKFNDLEILQQIFDYIEIDEVIINNLVSFPKPLKILEDLAHFKTNNTFRITYLVHDYFCLCPNFNLFGNEKRYCELPSDLKICQTCLGDEPLNPALWPKDFQSLRQWRNKWFLFLELCSRIVCFSEFSKQTLLKNFRDLDGNKVEVIPHGICPLPDVYSKSSRTPKVSIGVIGNINSEEKGSRILYEIANCIEKNEYSNIRIVVVGEMLQLKYRHKLIERTGFFEHNDLPSLMLHHKIDIILIPSVVPETFSYTTAEAISMGFPVAAFDLGAPAEQVRQYEKGVLLKDYDPEYIMQTLVNHLEKNN